MKKNLVYLGAWTARVEGQCMTITTNEVHPLEDNCEWRAVLKIACYEWQPEA